MGLKSLAEAIILQSAEDLFDRSLKEESIAFFTGDNFPACAELAGMNTTEQIRLLMILKGQIYPTGKMEERRLKRQGRSAGPCLIHNNFNYAS